MKILYNKLINGTNKFKKILIELFLMIIFSKMVLEIYSVNKFFYLIQDISGKERLHKILLAYSNLDPEVGYTQGMNYIVAAILLCLNPDNDKILEEGIILICQNLFKYLILNMKKMFFGFLFILCIKKSGET